MSRPRGLRVIAGENRGRRLVSPLGNDVRPTKDIEREAMFSALDSRQALVDAGQNDCGSNKTAHSCAGHSKMDYDPNDFKVVKAGTCVQMGGSMMQGEAGKLAKDKMMKKG
jgi:uncharacterized membrane protein